KTIKKVILNGIDHRVYYPTNKKKNAKIVILFVARIVPRKGLLYLLKAFKNLLKKTKNIKLTVLGDGPQLSTCMKYARIHNFKKYINFKGYIIGKEKIRSYQEADIFCAPYRNEAFGLTLLEAMAIGVPIVSFKNSAFKEILKDYPYQELLVKPKDTNKLAEALSKLINNEKMRKELSSWEIKESKKYSWKKVAKETEEFYYQILNK
ncbi:MAG: glycosyltransferase family 4 protein, partial [Candidatus Roizmanbacteria bacterium]|nr:glycosyltransferase family 4 protein [Candidatus Roizmanbacteria bacterium]